VAAFDGMKHPPAPNFLGREIEREARVGPGKTPVYLPMRIGLLVLRVAIDVRPAEKSIRDDVRLDVHG
jgi:hypothetical protein